VGYQISQLRGFASVTENIDAKVKGAELEFAWRPLGALRFDAALGWLNTGIVEGSSVDQFDRIQGQQGVTLVKATDATCLASTTQLASLIALINAGTVPRSALLRICSGGVASVTPLESNPVNLAGNELPQSPELTGTVGTEIDFGIGGNWRMTIRGDYYYQAASFTRVYNTVSDEIHAWSNVNAAIKIGNPSIGLAIELYGKNLLDKDVITGYVTNSDQLGLTRTVMTLDPRLLGLKVSYQFGK
jgi:outer membrane receptor protein involved in Fe transport